MSAEIQSHKDLIVWQKAMELCVLIYALTGNFPQSEIYGLTSQMRRAAVSIPSNIAEGKNRGTAKDFSNFLRISYGSTAELETQLDVAKRLGLCKDADFIKTNALLQEISKMLRAMIKKLGQ